MTTVPLKLSMLRFGKALIAASVTFACLSQSMIADNEIASAQSSRRFNFQCEYRERTYTTVATRVSNGRKTSLINWNKGGLGEYSDADRCDIVTSRLQRLEGWGQLNLFTYGIVNGENVICGVASTDKDGCFNRNMIYTLRRGANPVAKVANLREVQTGRINSPINESQGRLYLEFDKYVDLVDSSEITPDQL